MQQLVDCLNFLEAHTKFLEAEKVLKGAESRDDTTVVSAAQAAYNHAEKVMFAALAKYTCLSNNETM
jgi:hypothetical protein